MNIVDDKRKTNIIYVDKENNQVAYNDEVFKLVNNDNDANINIYIGLIAISKGLNDTEIEVLKYVILHSKVAMYSVICNDVAEIVNKSNMTIARAIDNLRNKGLVYIDKTRYVFVSINIAADVASICKAKYFIIETNPYVTSNNMDI